MTKRRLLELKRRLLELMLLHDLSENRHPLFGIMH